MRCWRLVSLCLTGPLLAVDTGTVAACGAVFKHLFDSGVDTRGAARHSGPIERMFAPRLTRADVDEGDSHGGGRVGVGAGRRVRGATAGIAAGHAGSARSASASRVPPPAAGGAGRGGHD